MADYLAQSRKTETARVHAASLKRGDVYASWYENDARRLTTQVMGISSHPNKPDSEHAMVASGVASSVHKVKLLRQERLKELFTREALYYEEELKSIGLSLVKPRD